MSVYSIPVTLGIDEKAIEKKIIENAENHVIKVIENEVRNTLFDFSVSYFNKESRVEEIAREEIVKMLDKNQDKIIELAAEKLADKLSRQKAVKEKAGDVAKEIFGE